MEVEKRAIVKTFISQFKQFFCLRNDLNLCKKAEIKLRENFV